MPGRIFIPVRVLMVRETPEAAPIAFIAFVAGKPVAAEWGVFPFVPQGAQN